MLSLAKALVCSPFVIKLGSFRARWLQVLRRVVCGLLVGWFLWSVTQFHWPGKGFTQLVRFGSRQMDHYLPELKSANVFVENDSPGYDGQYYAEIAMHPRLGDPVLAHAVDTLPYRAHRILFCWTAWVLAGGDPVGALHVYAVQNIICWLVLALLLLRWFPPVNWGNVMRWSAVMFSAGLCVSVRGALVDGPSLLLIATGMALLEADRPWLSAAVFGVSGLGRETNVIAGVCFAPGENRFQAWTVAFVRGLIVLFPSALWSFCLWRWFGDGHAGLSNFAFPFSGYLTKWTDACQAFADGGLNWVVVANLCVLVALTAQWLFFALRPRWSEPWWRLGAVYAAFMTLLGDAVWEGYIGASVRVLLPMTLAFNILVPRGRTWWLLLLLGNFTMFLAPSILRSTGGEGYLVQGPHELLAAESSKQALRVSFDGQWYGTEGVRWNYWRWARGPAELTIHNSQPFPLRAKIGFSIRSIDLRRVELRDGTHVLWAAICGEKWREVTMDKFTLPPGDLHWRFESDRPSTNASKKDSRELAFCLQGLKIEVEAKVEK